MTSDLPVNLDPLALVHQMWRCVESCFVATRAIDGFEHGGGGTFTVCAGNMNLGVAPFRMA